VAGCGNVNRDSAHSVGLGAPRCDQTRPTGAQGGGRSSWGKSSDFSAIRGPSAGVLAVIRAGAELDRSLAHASEFGARFPTAGGVLSAMFPRPAEARPGRACSTSDSAAIGDGLRKRPALAGTGGCSRRPLRVRAGTIRVNRSSWAERFRAFGSACRFDPRQPRSHGYILGRRPTDGRRGLGAAHMAGVGPCCLTKAGRDLGRGAGPGRVGPYPGKLATRTPWRSSPASADGARRRPRPVYSGAEVPRSDFHPGGSLPRVPTGPGWNEPKNCSHMT